MLELAVLDGYIMQVFRSSISSASSGQFASAGLIASWHLCDAGIEWMNWATRDSLKQLSFQFQQLISLTYRVVLVDFFRVVCRPRIVRERGSASDGTVRLTPTLGGPVHAQPTTWEDRTLRWLSKPEASGTCWPRLNRTTTRRHPTCLLNLTVCACFDVQNQTVMPTMDIGGSGLTYEPWSESQPRFSSIELLSFLFFYNKSGEYFWRIVRTLCKVTWFWEPFASM